MHNERFDNDNKEVVLSSTTTPYLGGILGTYWVVDFLFWIWVLIMALIWVIGGISAFFASLVCMFYNSTMADKIVGLFLAIFFGPLYWGFYIYKANYCTRYQTVNYYE